MNMYKVITNTTSGKRQLYPYNPETFDAASIEALQNNTTKPECYESIFIYNDEHKEHLNKTGSLSGLDGVITDRIVWDFDKKDNPQVALSDARSLVHNLIKQQVNPQAIRIYFSGNKGYHVEIRFNEYISQPEFKALQANLAGHLESFDTSINDCARIFRYPLSFHKLGKKFKIPIPIDVFLDEDYDHNSFSNSEEAENGIADEALVDTFNEYGIVAVPETFKPLMVIKTEKPKPTEPQLEIDGEQPDMNNRPKHLSPAKYALMQGFFESGERHEACMTLAATFRSMGYPKEVAYNTIKGILRLRNRRLELGDTTDEQKADVWKEVSSVYSPEWKGGTYSEKEGLLSKTIERYDLQSVQDQEFGLVNIWDVADHFKDFAQNIDKNTIRLGIDEIDKRVRITTSMFVCLLAPPSAGKSSVAFGILNELSKIDEKAIFFSMDMAIPQIYQRLIQRHTGDDEDIIMKNYKENNTEAIQTYQDILNKEFKNVKLCFRTGVTTENIRNAIISEIDKMGIKPRLVVIDYLECIQGPFSDPTANKALIATQLKDIANELGICIFLLVQPAKISGDPSQELKSYTQIKGSSVLGEAATIVMAMYRPGFSPKNPHEDKFLTINVVKNRMGKLSSTDLHWDGLTGRVRALTSEEKVELAELKERRANEESGGDNSYVQNGKFVPKKGDYY